MRGVNVTNSWLEWERRQSARRATEERERLRLRTERILAAAALIVLVEYAVDLMLDLEAKR